MCKLFFRTTAYLIFLVGDGSAATVTINTSTLTIGGEAESSFLSTSVVDRFLVEDDIATLYVLGDASFFGDTVEISGNKPLSVVSNGNIDLQGATLLASANNRLGVAGGGNGALGTSARSGGDGGSRGFSRLGQSGGDGGFGTADGEQGSAGLEGRDGEDGEDGTAASGFNGAEGFLNPNGGGAGGNPGMIGLGGGKGEGGAAFDGGLGGTSSNRDGQPGMDGDPGDDGENGTRNGGKGFAGNPGLNNVTGDILSGGGGGGSGGTGGSGGGGGGGGGGGSGSGGGGGASFQGAMSGGRGGIGGNSGSGGGGGNGGNGGGGGFGGGGGGAISFTALGRIFANATFEVRGGSGDSGDFGENGQPPSSPNLLPSPGADGVERSGAIGDGGDGGDGGSGGIGGHGSNGGNGGQGADGAGGTIRLQGSVVELAGATVDASGGTQGRLLVKANAVTGSPVATMALREDFGGPLSVNSFIQDMPGTPLLPDLVGGPSVAGISSEVSTEDVIFTQVFDDLTAASDVGIALIDESFGMLPAFPGFNLLAIGKFTEEAGNSFALDISPLDEFTGVPATTSIDGFDQSDIFLTLVPTGEIAVSFEFGSNQITGLTLTPGSNAVFSATSPADFDNDGDVDADDLIQWGSDFALNGESDADLDGDSDGNDFLLWQRNFGAGTLSTNAVPVPEPSTMMLLLFTVLQCSSRNGSIQVTGQS